MFISLFIFVRELVLFLFDRQASIVLGEGGSREDYCSRRYEGGGSVLIWPWRTGEKCREWLRFVFSRDSFRDGEGEKEGGRGGAGRTV